MQEKVFSKPHGCVVHKVQNATHMFCTEKHHQRCASCVLSFGWISGHCPDVDTTPKCSGCKSNEGCVKGVSPGMRWKGGRRPAYAQPLSPWRQMPASMAFVTDRSAHNRFGNPLQPPV